MNSPIHQLERVHGELPREHQFSALEQLEQGGDNPEVVVFMAAAEKLITQWTGDQFAGLYLYGEPGTGKTHAAIGLARALHQTGATIHYRHVPSWRPRERSKRHGMDMRIERMEPHLTDWLGPEYNMNGLPIPFPTSRTRVGGDFATRREDVHEKSVLILDDYKPHARNYVSSAIEAASQYGGLVVITSNYTDPFKIIEETPQEKEMNSRIQALSELAPSIASYGNNLRSEQAATRDAMRSRVAASFRFIHFEGEDRRPQNSFWSD